EDRRMYDYDSRNRSTAHVHMMLSTALTAMIDQAECVVFLNTGDSATVRRSVTETESPWIFFEIETVNRIRSREPARLLRKGHEKFGRGDIGGIDEAVRYPLSLGSFTELDVDRLKSWRDGKRGAPWEHPLDVLYGMYR
ncbi:MAG TPA: hypothetical protein PKY30_23710, partial [Myxococcota bacterium]|nr:hypothetical protein [Myxococcota bacterium]